MKLYVTRHGETPMNAAHRVCGLTNIDLTEKGIKRIGSAVLFGILLNMGVVGVWIAMGMDWLARSVAFVWLFKSKKWQKFRPI